MPISMYGDQCMDYKLAEDFITTISELAKEANGSDVYFGMIPVHEDNIYHTITLCVLSQLYDSPREVLLASIVALNVQQFVDEFKRLKGI